MPEEEKICPVCNGFRTCPKCGSTGRDPSDPANKACSACNGTGDCPNCFGKGWVPK